MLYQQKSAMLQEMFTYIIKNIDVDLKYIISLLNSKLFYQWFYYRGKRKGNILELYAKPLKEVPIYLPNINKQKLFINVVEKIIALKASDKDTTILEQQIDNMVYKLYELTYEEVKIIDPENTLTEKEYADIKI